MEKVQRLPKTLGVVAILILLMGANLWYDYYHPLGFLVDAAIASVLAFKYIGR